MTSWLVELSGCSNKNGICHSAGNRLSNSKAFVDIPTAAHLRHSATLRNRLNPEFSAGAADGMSVVGSAHFQLCSVWARTAAHPQLGLGATSN